MKLNLIDRRPVRHRRIGAFLRKLAIYLESDEFEQEKEKDRIHNSNCSLHKYQAKSDKGMNANHCNHVQFVDRHGKIIRMEW